MTTSPAADLEAHRPAGEPGDAPIGGPARAADAQAESASPPAERPPPSRQGLLATLVLLVVVWTYAYNVLIKEQHPLAAFFKIVDTISDDFVIGSLVTIGAGLAIALFFSLTKIYSQIMANARSFRVLEEMVADDLARGHVRAFVIRLFNFRDQPQPGGSCPTRIWALLASCSFLYLVSWIYLVLFSEALFFVSWSAGVDLPINEHTMIQMPMLALAIPFSARVMAYLRYPYAQDFADFMPGAVFVLLVVAALGFLFESPAQQFYLVRVFSNQEFAASFLKNGAFLAFIPVFFEIACWTVELTRPARQ
jgi:hypothetical protein